MTTSGAATTDMGFDEDADDDLAGWQADPSPQHPHIALLLGGSILIVVLACVLPLFVVENVRPGMHQAGLMLTVVVALSCGLGPFLTHRLQNTRYVVCALVVLDLMPLTLATSLKDDSPVRQWTSLLLIPVLISAATLNRRLYVAQLVAGCLVGIAVMVIRAPGVEEGLLTCVGCTFLIVVCASLARQDRTALDVRFRQWLRRSRRDELTGLLNRRGFVAGFPQVRRECVDSDVPIGIVMIDIDHFSRLNAVHGHAYGDAVLRDLCALVSELPEVAEGIVARIGGEELVVVVPRPAGTTAVALREALARSSLHPGLTVSMGIADADPRSCTDIDAMWRLVHLTDAAMYRAKQEGRDRIARAEPGAGGGPDTPPGARGDGEADRTGTRPVPPHWGPRPVGPALPTGGPDETGCPDAVGDDAGDGRLFGAYCLVFAAIGLCALLIPVAVDRGSDWSTVFAAGLVAMAVLGAVAVGRRQLAPPLLVGVICVVIEVSTLSAVLATGDLEHRLMIISVLTVPVLVSAHAMPLPWLGGQILLVFVGVGIAATSTADTVDAEWMHRTLSQAAVLCAAPGVLFWLRQRRERANTRLRRLASIDPLTGVLNRTGLEHHVIRGTTGGDVRILTFDVVGFKSLNDTYGHVFGDEVLVHVARALTTAVATTLPADRTGGTAPPDPVVGRTGGDRFVVAGPEPLDPALPGRIARTLQTFPAEVAVATGEAVGPVRDAAGFWALIATAETTMVRPAVSRRPGTGGITTGRGRTRTAGPGPVRP
ncbi:GGDEF domain-containing protein [Nakamurella deserti]|uniref:GGDEF domain-containing protein n=1 Tax=Nakamurella deserti TaxID=2164074 RepID=UPI000DBE8B47|nr:diguanylate cyclase [Nakamurella deserti]